LIRGPTWREVGGGGAVAEGPDMRQYCVQCPQFLGMAPIPQGPFMYFGVKAKAHTLQNCKVPHLCKVPWDAGPYMYYVQCSVLVTWVLLFCHPRCHPFITKNFYKKIVDKKIRKFWKMGFFLSVSLTNFAIFLGKNITHFFISQNWKKKEENFGFYPLLTRNYLTRIFHYYLACISKN
jgi:hypothetical protein